MLRFNASARLRLSWRDWRKSNQAIQLPAWEIVLMPRDWCSTKEISTSFRMIISLIFHNQIGIFQLRIKGRERFLFPFNSFLYIHFRRNPCSRRVVIYNHSSWPSTWPIPDKQRSCRWKFFLADFMEIWLLTAKVFKKVHSRGRYLYASN